MKKKMALWKKIAIGVLVLAVIGGIMSQLNGNKDDNPKLAATEQSSQKQEDAAQSKQEEEKTEFMKGETVDLKGVKVTLSDITESTGNEVMKPKDGSIFLLATFEIDNGSEKELNISSMLSFDAYVDGYSTNVDLSALASSEDEQLDGKVAPGKKMKGVVGYEVPSDYKNLEIKFKPDVLGKEITFKYDK